jgi:hypothetical protein
VAVGLDRSGRQAAMSVAMKIRDVDARSDGPRDVALAPAGHARTTLPGLLQLQLAASNSAAPNESKCYIVQICLPTLYLRSILPDYMGFMCLPPFHVHIHLLPIPFQAF